MIVVEKTGKTTDEAIEAALAELKASREDVTVEIMESPSKGLFGLFGSKGARVKVTMAESQSRPAEKMAPPLVKKETEKSFTPVAADHIPSTAVSEEAAALAVEFLENVFQKMGVAVKTEISQTDEFLHLAFTGDDLGILIGRRGETLDALQYLANLVVSKKVVPKVRIVLDVEGYRRRREETLVKLAQRLADKVKKTGHNIVLEPMSPHERRIIHTALQNDLKVRTYSEGEEPYRKVIITRKS